MTSPLANMIGWIFKQGMAAVALDEKFKGIDQRFTALEGRLEERFKALDAKIDQKIDHLDEKIDLVRSELSAKVEGLRGEMKASIDLHERIASIEARMPQKSA
jgi:chromosome segregation ATPase